MRVIHGVWAHGALCLWAEDPDLPPVPAAAPHDVHRHDVHLPRPHPFACQAAELADMLAGRPGAAGDAARKAVHHELTLQLPSAGGGPLASPELVRPEPPGTGSESPGPARRGAVHRRVSLASWRVPVLAFGPADALAVLGGAGQPDDVAAAGGSLAYLAAAARFAVDLAARGRVLPVLAAEGRGEGRWVGYAARWRPVLGGADAQRAHDLAAAMPPSCRAAGAQAPGPLLGSALEALADAAARTRLPASLLPARRGRTPARLPVATRDRGVRGARRRGVVRRAAARPRPRAAAARARASPCDPVVPPPPDGTRGRRFLRRRLRCEGRSVVDAVVTGGDRVRHLSRRHERGSVHARRPRRGVANHRLHRSWPRDAPLVRLRGSRGRRGPPESRHVGGDGAHTVPLPRLRISRGSGPFG